MVECCYIIVSIWLLVVTNNGTSVYYWVITKYFNVFFWLFVGII